MKLCGSCFRHQSRENRYKALLGIYLLLKGSPVETVKRNNAAAGHLDKIGYGRSNCPNCNLPCLWNPAEMSTEALMSAIMRTKPTS